MAPAESFGAIPASRTSHCPDWCVVRHGVLTGEEDWVHVGTPVPVGERSLARLCMTVDPEGGDIDGPFVLLGLTEYTPDDAERLGGPLAVLARQALQGRGARAP